MTLCKSLKNKNMEKNAMNEKDKGRGGLRISIYLLIVHRHKRKRIYREKNKDLYGLFDELMVCITNVQQRLIKCCLNNAVRRPTKAKALDWG